MARARIELADVLRDPLAALGRARDAGWLAETEFSTAVLTHESVRDLLGDPRLRANFPQFLRVFGITSGPFFEWMSRSPLNKDGAEHQQWRALMSRTFTPRRVETIRPFLRDAAHTLIDGFATRGQCEFVAEFADAYPSLGLCELIGVPKEDRDTFRGWANTIGLGFSPVALTARIGEVDEALTKLMAYTAALADARRAEPRDDLVTRIAQAALEEGFDQEEANSWIAGLVFAGHETTKNQLGWMVAVLAGKADVWNAVKTGALSAADVVEEVMRYRSAVTAVGRQVEEPLERHGERLEPGTQLLLSLWSADHDGGAFPQPDVFDPRANGETPHLAFGHGAHFCLGAALARTELQEALTALTSRISCPTVGDGASWKPPVGINGPLELPITFRATT